MKRLLQSLQSLGLYPILSVQFQRYLLEMFQTFVLEHESVDTPNPTTSLSLQRPYCASFEHWAQSILFPWLRDIDQISEFSLIKERALHIFLEFRCRFIYDSLVLFPHNLSFLEDLKYLFDELSLPSFGSSSRFFDFRNYLKLKLQEPIQQKWLSIFNSTSSFISQKSLLEKCLNDVSRLFKSLCTLDDSGFLAYTLLNPISLLLKKSNHSHVMIAEFLFDPHSAGVLFPEELTVNEDGNTKNSSTSSLLRESLSNIQKLKKIRLYNQLLSTDSALLELFDNDELNWRPSTTYCNTDANLTIPEYFKQGDLISYLLNLAKSKMILFDCIQASFGRALLDPLISTDHLLEVKVILHFKYLFLSNF